MFHKEKYLRTTHFYQKLAAKLEVEEKLINQTIFVRDLFVYGNYIYFDRDYSFGEVGQHQNKYQNLPVVDRLLDYINFLADIANKYHEVYYCEEVKKGNYTIKKDSLNKITRILLHEFALYTKDALKLDEFSLLLDGIHAIAEKKHRNVHLLLSSFAVKCDDKLLNLSLYIQCGEEPIIRHICKASASLYDIEYKFGDNFTQTSADHNNASEYIVSTRGKIISSNSVFLIETVGRAKGIVAVDVCLDAIEEHSRALLDKFLEIDRSKNTMLIPYQVNYIISSNVRIPEPQKKPITDALIQVDPEYCKAVRMEDDRVTLADLSLIEVNMQKYPNLSILNSRDGFNIYYPPFGPSVKLIPTKEENMGQFAPDLYLKISHKNTQTKKFFIMSRLNQMQQVIVSDDVISIAKIKMNTEQLYKVLLQKCQHEFLQNMFNVQYNQLKRDVRLLTEGSFNSFLKICDNWLDIDSVKFMTEIDQTLTSLKNKIIELDRFVQRDHGLLKKVISEIEAVEIYFQPFKLDHSNPSPHQ